MATKMKKTVYVMGDIHGNVKAFDSIMERIQLKDDEILWVLGDVIDRHPHGLYILRKIMKSSNIKMLLGNHEIMMMQALGIPHKGQDIRFGIPEDKLFEQWYNNGGQLTHYEWEYDLTKAEQMDVKNYLENCKTSTKARSIEDKETILFYLAHSVPMYLYETYGINNEHGFGPLEWSVWDRSMYKNPIDLGAPMIFGHTPTPIIYNDITHKNVDTNDPEIITLKSGDHDNDWIGIDCGAGWRAGQGGRLACIRLNDMHEIYSE